MGIFSAKEKTTNTSLEYDYYIRDHINNIHKAYDMYGKQLCDKLDVSSTDLFERTNKHDESKFYDVEYYGYSQYFYPKRGTRGKKEDFDVAWLHHQNHNDHHPEYWVLRGEEGKYIILDMPNICIAEMLLDWAAMSIKFGNSVKSYYKDKGHLHPMSDNTRKTVEKLLYIFEE